MRVPSSSPWLVTFAAVIAVACGSSAPSATARPELAWSRATIGLPADVVEIAPGSSAGIQCSPCHAAQASLMTGVATTPDGLLAVGIQQPPSSAVAYRSPDGRHWEPEPGFAPGDDTVALAAAADDSRQVIVGMHGAAAAAWVKLTGAGAWRQAPASPSLRGPAGGSAELRAVAPWRGGFVAAGSRNVDATSRSAAIWASDDGLSWRQVGSGSAFDGATACGIAATGRRLVVVGEAEGPGNGPAVVWVSDDGETWTHVESPAFAAGPMRAVTATRSGFVAVGFSSSDDGAVAWTSADGLTWETQPTDASLENLGKAIRMLAVTSDGGRLVAAGWKSDAGNGSGMIWESSPGGPWDRLPDQVSMSGASLSGVIVAGGAPVAVGTSGYPDNDQASVWFDEH